MDRKGTIIKTIESFDQIQLISDLEESENKTINATIQADIGGVLIPFSMQILHAYPFQFHDSESIRFINDELIKYNHVNADGSVCIHTTNYPDNLESKLKLDFKGLISWCDKYYLNKERDDHYEHLIVSTRNLDGVPRHFLFTDLPHAFRVGEFGLFGYSKLSDTNISGAKGETYLIQRIGLDQNAICGWSEIYKNVEPSIGFYVFCEAPVKRGQTRFIVNNWCELEEYVSQEFLMFLSHEKERNKRLRQSEFIPFMIGYKIPGNKVHFQVALFHNNQYPNYGDKIEPGKWRGKLIDEPINWSTTIDCSYELFFGRGKFTEKLIGKKILLLGIGAVGSQVAEALTRGGARDLALIDYDLKEPGNVCRSVYSFLTGVTNKTDELALRLWEISPFVNIKVNNHLTDQIKLLKLQEHELKPKLIEHFNNFDYVVDCTTDNDLLYILESLGLEAEIISMAITNHANELVCTTGANIYERTKFIFDKQHQDNGDLFNPTGCWSPTFKASYSDISILVNTTLNELNNQLIDSGEIRSFYVSRKQNNIEVCRY